MTADTPPRWRPIETAPRDGTRILVWTSAGAEIVSANDAHDPGAAVWDWLAVDCVRVVATHWQPLPTPPEDAAP